MHIGLGTHPTPRMPVLDTATGDSHETKPPKNFRFGFNNINGLPLSPASLQDFIGTVQDLQLDWVGIAETHLDTTKPHVRETFKSKMQSNQGFLATNCVFVTSDISFGLDRKRGGILQMAVGNLATRTIKQHTDPYGRFTSKPADSHRSRWNETYNHICLPSMWQESAGPIIGLCPTTSNACHTEQTSEPSSCFHRRSHCLHSRMPTSRA